VADPYVTLDARVRAILFEARGADGALGADALALHVPAGRYRTERDQCPLTDPSYEAEYFDGAVRLEWGAESGENNPLDNVQIKTARLLVHLGVAGSQAMAPWVFPLSDGASATLRPYPRGMGKCRRITDALECPDLVRDGTEVDPVPIGITAAGDTTPTNLGGGRMVFTTPYDFLYRVLRSNRGDP